MTFDVLSRDLDLNKNYLLEASAGTGKTFSIENIVTRLLILGNPLEEILIVTFTRAAARDLKLRIRQSIEKTLKQLKHPEEGCPDYLQGLIECGDELIKQARKRLERALFAYDEAEIYTIHGFCARMLSNFVFEGGMGLIPIDGEQGARRDEIARIVRDVFRTDLTKERYRPAEIEMLMQQHGQSVEKLEQKLVATLLSGASIEPIPDAEELYERLTHLRPNLPYDKDKILEDFMAQVPNYRGLASRQGELKPEILASVQRFASLFLKSTWDREDFDLLIRDQLSLLQFLDPAKRKKKVERVDLHYPDLLSVLKETLTPLIHPLNPYARILYDSQQTLEHYFEENERFGFDDILKAMLEGLKHPDFVAKVRQSYCVAVIDEFQDTDPIQWKIFKELFYDDPVKRLYIVGDPKQSIYAFRQADIYTYLSAAEALGKESKGTLGTNYRSQPSLIRALNRLFSEEQTPNLIALPRTKGNLPYLPVGFPADAKEKTFSDRKGSLHFVIAHGGKSRTFPLEEVEKGAFFPFITEEIWRLHRDDGVPFRDIAILVADRFQGERLAAYLKQASIPALMQRNQSLVDSAAFSQLYELLVAVLNLRDSSALKRALGGRLFGWDHHRIKRLEDPQLYAVTLFLFQKLERKLFNEGIASFFEALMQTEAPGETQSVAERLLSQEGGCTYFDDLQQIVELLYVHQSETHRSAEGLLSHMQELASLNGSDEVRLRKRTDPFADAVHVITLHSSKGLEYPIVFPLGLIRRSRPPSQFVPKPGLIPSLSVVYDKTSEIYQNYAEEIDAEKMRQLYVAMTRAKHRLYVPVVLLEEGRAVEQGCASPMELFLARFGYPITDSQGLYERISGYDGTPLLKFLEEDTEITTTTVREALPPTNYSNTPPNPILIAPDEPIIPGNPQQMFSFTSLAQTTHIKRESSPPFSYDNPIKTPHTLPSGSETGTLLHEILEVLSFAQVAPLQDYQALIPEIERFVNGTRYLPWIDVIAEIAFNALKTPLIDDFSLSQLAENQCYKEMEFLYPAEKGFLKGVIDLIFTWKGKYYVLDWKSNWLGENSSDYHPEALKGAMEEHDYFLQATIYEEAVRRYLATVEDLPFEKIYGGTFYLFLRGLSQNGSDGIYHLGGDYDR